MAEVEPGKSGTKGEYMTDVLLGGWIVEQREGQESLLGSDLMLIRKGIEIGLEYAMPDFDERDKS